jgi:hypothetical protein
MEITFSASIVKSMMANINHLKCLAHFQNLTLSNLIQESNPNMLNLPKNTPDGKLFFSTHKI